jgi:succinate-acetate transporter protein
MRTILNFMPVLLVVSLLFSCLLFAPMLRLSAWLSVLFYSLRRRFFALAVSRALQRLHSFKTTKGLDHDNRNENERTDVSRAQH